MEPEELKSQISRVVDMWVSDVLRSRFLQKPESQERRSLWDKFKQGLTNWWWGRNGDKYNPYKWRNRFGNELGVTESFYPAVFTLHDYKNIRTLVESVEYSFNESDEGFDNLRLMQIVRSAAEQLKDMLFDALKGRVQSVASAEAEQPSTKVRPKTDLVQDPRATDNPQDDDSNERHGGAMGLIKKPAAARNKRSRNGERTRIATGSSTPPKAARKSQRTALARAPKKTTETKASEGEVPKSTASGGEVPKSTASGGEVPKSTASGGNASNTTQQVDEDNELKGYLYDGDKKKTPTSVMNLVRDFVIQVGRETQRVDEAKRWLSVAVEELQKITKANDRFNFLKTSIMSKSGSYVEGIAKAVGLDKDELRQRMEGFLESEKTKDEVDESLGIDSYLVTDGKPHGLDRTLDLVGRYIKVPLSRLGVNEDDPRVKALNEWWKKEKDEISKKSDPMDYVKKSLMKDGSWFESMGKVLDKSPIMIKNMMVNHIKKKSNRA